MVSTVNVFLVLYFFIFLIFTAVYRSPEIVQTLEWKENEWYSCSFLVLYRISCEVCIGCDYNDDDDDADDDDGDGDDDENGVVVDNIEPFQLSNPIQKAFHLQ